MNYLNLLAIRDLGLRKLTTQLLELGISLLEIVVIVELERVLASARHEAASTSAPTAPPATAPELPCRV